MWKKICSLLLMLSCFTVIFCFSGQNGTTSASVSSKAGSLASQFIFLKRLFTLFPIRKIAHFSLYGLTFLAVLFFICSWFNISMFLKSIASLGVVFIYACSDEFHQSFISGRSSEFRDVLIDFSGAITALVVVLIMRFLYLHMKKRILKMHTLEILLSKTDTFIGGAIRGLIGANYNHCAIMLDKDSSHIYSFTRKYKHCWFTGCFTIEPYDRFQDFVVYSIDITDKDYERIVSFLDELGNSFRIYNYIGAILLYFGIATAFPHNYVCSTFAAKVLSLVDSVDLETSAYLYKPNDLYKFLKNSY